MQAGILAMTGIIVRIIGLLYRGPLTAILGDEGNGYYGYAYDCYTIALLISSYSIPAALSRIISGKLAVGEYVNAQRFFRCALYYVCAVGGLISLLLMIFAPSFVADANAAPVLRVFAPTVLLCGILGVFRGYYQAHRTMVQTSVSQILEQIGNAVISILMALILRATVSLPAEETEAAMEAYRTTRAARGAMGSAVGTGVGVLIALVFMIMLYSANRRYVHERMYYDVHKPESMGKMFGTLIAFVTPFIISTFIYNFVSYVNQRIFSSVVTGRSVSVLTSEAELAQIRAQTAAQYGIFSQKALVLTNIPIAVAAAVSAAMIPEIAGLLARRKRKTARNRSAQVIRMTMLVAIPCAVGLFALARPVTMLLFPQQESLNRASFLLMVMAVTVVLYSLSTLTNAILQSAGHIWTPALNGAAALVAEALILYLLLFIPGIGNFALAIAVIIHSLLTCVLNQMAIRRHRLSRMDVRHIFLEPLVAALIMGAAAVVVYYLLWALFGLLIGSAWFVNLLSLIPAILVAIYVYAAALLKTGVLTEAELLRFPKGESLVRLARKTGILKRKKSRSSGYLDEYDAYDAPVPVVSASAPPVERKKKTAGKKKAAVRRTVPKKKYKDRPERSGKKKSRTRAPAFTNEPLRTDMNRSKRKKRNW
ncbi:MAG: polysaccharide biosynthesis protein [Lachnospiraceae bacterium]|nr:polysaccharide biosynthesis protein [Lachnospiraceae bacterium]